MKKLLITFILIITSTISLFGINKSDSNKNILFGVKIAMTFSSSGDINDISEELSTIDNAKTIAYGSSIGLYAQIKIFSFYVRPELQYSAYDTNYENIFIATERCMGGTLEDFIKSLKPANFDSDYPTVRRLFAEIMVGLAILSERQIKNTATPSRRTNSPVMGPAPSIT